MEAPALSIVPTAVFDKDLATRCHATVFWRQLVITVPA